MVNIVIDAAGTVLMWSENGRPTPPPDCELIELTDLQAGAFRATPNEHGLAFDGDAFTALPGPQPTIPRTASSGNFVRALHELGWIADVKIAVAAVGGLAADLWLHASLFERDHPMVVQIAQAIGKTSADLDTLFLLAASYDAP